MKAYRIRIGTQWRQMRDRISSAHEMQIQWTVNAHEYPVETEKRYILYA